MSQYSDYSSDLIENENFEEPLNINVPSTPIETFR